MTDLILRSCPECQGDGVLYLEAEGPVECGVCCGDRFIWPAATPRPSWLADRFMDHSHYDHRCSVCQPPTEEYPGAAEQLAAYRDQIVEDLQGALACGDDGVRGYMTASYLYLIAETLGVDHEPMFAMDEMADRIRYVLGQLAPVGAGR
jgi:hypothetical protein